jgi:hypothetical protein
MSRVVPRVGLLKWEKVMWIPCSGSTCERHLDRLAKLVSSVTKLMHYLFTHSSQMMHGEYIGIHQSISFPILWDYDHAMQLSDYFKKKTVICLERLEWTDHRDLLKSGEGISKPLAQIKALTQHAPLWGILFSAEGVVRLDTMSPCLLYLPLFSLFLLIIHTHFLFTQLDAIIFLKLWPRWCARQVNCIHIPVVFGSSMVM